MLLTPDNSDLLRESDEVTSERAFAQILRGLAPGLQRHLNAQIGSGDAVDDIVQETFLRMLRYRDVTDSNELRALLYRVAANVVIDRHRQAQSHRADDHCALDTPNLPAAELQPERVHAGRQNLALIKAAIRDLPPRCREAFLLHRFEGLSYREIALRFGTSVRTVENQIAHALAACRRAVGEGRD